MKKVVWLFGALLALSFVFPNGLPLAKIPPAVKPVTPVAPLGPTDPVITKLLENATQEDRARVNGIYSGLKFVIERDKGEFISTTEKWAMLQANTLAHAVEQVGKYPGLDVAINDVFKQQLGTDDVLAVNSDVLARLIAACDIIVNSTSAK